MIAKEAVSADEIVTVEELIELANSIALDHFEHVYIEQFEQIRACLTTILDDVKEQVLADKQQLREKLEGIDDLTIERGEQVLQDLTMGPMHDFKGTLEAQFRQQMGIPDQTRVPAALIQDSEQ